MKKITVLLFFLPSVAFSAPSVSSVTGTIQNGQSVVLGGSNFGAKSPAAPLLWAPFDNNGNPSGLGQLTAFGQVQAFAWDADEGYNGGGGMKGTAGNGTWTLWAYTNGAAYNAFSSKTYTFHREKMNFIVLPGNNENDINFKTFRIWPQSGNVSNLYFSSSHNRIFVENIGGSTDAGYFKNCNPSTTNWFVKERFIVASSANGVKDGTTEERFNGVTKHSGNIISRSAAAPNDWTKMVTVQGDASNEGSWDPPWSSSNNIWADDVYVDRTFARVMIGDASTLANSRKLGICIPSSWAATSVTCQLSIPTNDFPAGTTAYLYVVDSSNVPNTAGKQIVIGGSVVGNPAPTIQRVSPSTGAFQGTTASTAVGTGFLSGATVLVGTTPATGVGLSGSTSVYFRIPANVPGTVGYDLTITNSDGQFAVLPSTIGYTSAVANQPPFNVNAGDDWEITLPATTLLSGAAEDDGLPSGTLTYLWQQKSGPGTVTFSDPTALQTSAVFSTDGTYYVTLTADDSAFSVESSSVAVIVHPAVVINANPGRVFNIYRP